MNTFAERRKSATPAEATIRLCLDLRLHDQLRTAYQELRRRQMAAAREAKDDGTLLDDRPRGLDESVTEQLWVVDEIEATLEERSEPYVFRALPRHRWDALGDEHPATEEQIDEVRKLNAEAKETTVDGERPQLIRLPQVNQDTFWPAAIAECSHDPDLTVEDAVWLRDGDDDWPGLPPSEWNRIVAELQALHGTGVVVPKELLDIARAARRARNGTTPASGVSPSPSSGAASRNRTSRTG